MRPLWLTVLVGTTLLCLTSFGALMTASVVAADNVGGETMPICTLPKCLNPRVTAKSGISTANATVEAKVTPDDAAKWCATYKPKDKLCTQEQVRSGWIGFKNLYRANADCVAGRMTAIDGNQYTYAGVWEDGPGKGRPKFTTTNRRFPHQKWDETGIEVHPSGSITGWGGGSPNLAAQWEVLCAGAPAPAMKVAAQPSAQAPQSAAPVPNAIQVRQIELQQFATETPLQSADFGTAEATAKIAAQAGSIDVVGVKLGMPLKDALDVLKAHNANFTMEPMTMPPYEALPGVVMTPAFLSQKNTKTASGQEMEQVGLLVTFAPNEPFVWGVWRDISFGKDDSRPTIDTILAGLRQKYGQESFKDVGTRLIWMYDTQGQQVPEAKAKEILAKCGVHASAGVRVAGTQMGNRGLHINNFNRQVVRGYFHNGIDPFNGLCQSYSYIEAGYKGEIPRGMTTMMALEVVVSASNRQLEVSGVTASHTLLMREATALAEKRKGEAAKREVPKF